MEKLQQSLDKWASKIGTTIRTEPTNVIHLPSFLLGCFLTVTVSVLIPLMKLFLSGLLLTLVMLLKYLVIGGAVVASIVIVITSSGRETRAKNKLQKAQSQLRQSKPPLPPRAVSTEQRPVSTPDPAPAMVYPPSDGTGLIKDDFEEIKHYDIPVTKSQHRKRQLDDHAYNSFINRAALNGVNC